MGYVYLLECISDYEQVYKIGYTKNKKISQRISNLQTGNQDDMEPLYMFETKHGRKLETALHNMYSHKRINREWFQLDLTDVVNFENTCSKVENNFDFLKNEKNNFF